MLAAVAIVAVAIVAVAIVAVAVVAVTPARQNKRRVRPSPCRWE